MSIVNTITQLGFFAQFNPTQFEEQLDVNYAAQTVPGLSHQPLHYTFTANHKIAIDLFFRGDDPERQAYVEDMRRFMLALCYPRAATLVAGGSPPRALLVWPNVLSMTTVVRSLRIRNTRFAIDGKPMEFTASVSFEEIRDFRLLSEDVREQGTLRSSNAPEGS